MQMSSCSGLAGRNAAPEGGGAPQDLCALQNAAEPPGVPNDALFPHAAARQRGAVLTPGKRTPPRRAMRSPSSLERGREREVPGLREVSGLTAQATAPVGFSVPDAGSGGAHRCTLQRNGAAACGSAHEAHRPQPLALHLRSRSPPGGQLALPAAQAARGPSRHQVTRG
jgi:hypothetical protein